MLRHPESFPLGSRLQSFAVRHRLLEGGLGGCPALPIGVGCRQLRERGNGTALLRASKGTTALHRALLDRDWRINAIGS